MTGDSDLGEEARAFNEQLRALLATVPGVETVPVELTRRSDFLRAAF